MVFTNLDSNEKQAFFSLLDEYFTSRPEVLKRVGSSNSDVVADLGSRFASAGWKHAHTVTKPNNVANQSAPPPVAEKPSYSGPSGLFSTKKIGDVDTSSKVNMIASLYSGNKDKTPAQAAHIPSAFAAKKNMFAPPPVRTASASAASSPSPPQRHRSEPEPKPEPEPEAEQGEWVEALYDYNSGEITDLSIKENDRILVTARTSDDWWMGECNGRKGLFPASYVKIL